jgi:putative ABC transport system substrate-binding protein
MNRRRFVFSVLAAIAAWRHAGAQPKVARIGFLWTSNPEAQYLEAFRVGLRDLGHVEGRNVLLEQRSAAGSVPSLDALAQELIGTGVDLVVTQGTPAARAAAKATSKIPIVVALGEPLGARLVTGFSRPGGNVTGLTVLASELNAKRLELLKEMSPKASRLAVLFDPTATNADGAPLLRTKELETAARSLGVRLTVLPVKGFEEFSKAFGAAAEARVDAVLLSPSPVLSFHNRLLVDLAARHRLPAVYGNPESVKLGGLMSYGPSYTALFRRAATYVDKILKGANPAELPIEQPVAFELAINLTTAKALGISVPRALVLRADHVIQ